MDLLNSRTEKNLRDAFSGESQARSRYDYYASQARKENLLTVADVFTRTANNEREHGKIWLKYLNGINNTEKNLESAVSGEEYEHTKMYPEFARIAREEGFEDIARHFELVANIEATHAAEYKKALGQVKANKVYERENQVSWRCMECGNIHIGNQPPEVCPVCAHSKAYFQVVKCEC